MRADACREWRAVLGVAALDRLHSGDDVALQAHLDGCPGCRAELRELRAVAAALPLADIDRVAADERGPSRELGEQVLARLAAARHVARRRRLVRVAAAAAVAVLLVATGAVVLSRDDDTPGIEVVFSGAEVHATAELRAVDAGTEVRLVASGFDDGDWYWLWVTGDDDRRVAAGTFRGTGGDIDVTTTAALALDETRRVWVTGADDEIVLDAHL